MNKFQKKIYNKKTFDDLYKFIKISVGNLSEEQKVERQTLRLHNCTRIIQDEESFETFVEQISTIVENIDEDDNTRKYLIKTKLKKLDPRIATIPGGSWKN